MKKSVFGIMFIVTMLSLVLVVGCSDKGSTQTSSGSGSDTAGNQSVEYKYSGTDLSITLAENPTTGYTWTYVIDGAGLNNVGDEYTASQSGQGLVGAGGTHTYTFKGTASGSATINFTYARNWESSPDDINYSLKVTMGDNGLIQTVEAV